MDTWTPAPQVSTPAPVMRPMQGLTTAALVLVVALLVLQTLNLVLFGTTGGLGSVDARSFAGQQGLDNLEYAAFAALFGSLVGAVGIAQLIVGLIWFFRASDNVTRRGLRDRKWGPGWAVGAWFIPIANAILGFFAIREIWRGSQPEARPDAWHGIRIPAWINTWWGIYIGQTLLSIGFFVYSMVLLVELFRFTIANPDATPVLPDFAAYQYVSHALYMAAGVFYIHFLRTVRRLQDEPDTMPMAPF